MTGGSARADPADPSATILRRAIPRRPKTQRICIDPTRLMTRRFTAGAAKSRAGTESPPPVARLARRWPLIEDYRHG
jgi:hypothetical protein